MMGMADAAGGTDELKWASFTYLKVFIHISQGIHSLISRYSFTYLKVFIHTSQAINIIICKTLQLLNMRLLNDDAIFHTSEEYFI